MDKEKLSESARFKVALATCLTEVALVILPALGIPADPELVKTVAAAIAIVASSFIFGRTLRNQ